MKIELSQEEIRLLIIGLNSSKDYHDLDHARDSIKLRSKLMEVYKND